MSTKILNNILNFLKDQWFKIGLLLILVGGLVIGTIIFLKIERDNASFTQQKYTDQKAQDQRDYIAKRTNDCFDIYNQEKKNWSNTTGVNYNQVTDKCEVTYNAVNGEWKGINCSDYSKIGSPLYSFPDWINCTNNTFVKEF